MYKESLSNLPLPDEAKAEWYERKPYNAIFDRIDLVGSFKAGKDGIGAVFVEFVESIYLHDEIAKAIDEKMDQIEELRRIEAKKNKVYRNWDSSYNVMNTFPAEFAEYLDILPKMKDYESRIKKITDPDVRAKAEMEFTRFGELKQKCSGLQAVHKALHQSKEDRDEARQILMFAEKELGALREQEVKIALKISDDHSIADEKGLFVGRIFPQVHEGDILCEINTQNVEDWPFARVMQAIRSSKSPHVTVFKRYDYKQDPTSGVWYTLQEMRDRGVFIDDPRLPKIDFIVEASRGNEDLVREAIASAIDLESVNHARCTALQAAASNNHISIVEMLLKAGARIDARDENMMTALLACVRKGYLSTARYLVEKGADKIASDKNKRGVLFYATLSENVNLVRYFVRSDNCNQTETFWGWTSLHLAANKGCLEVAQVLLEAGASIYRRSNIGETPEEVAHSSGRHDVYVYLRDIRLSATQQQVYKDDKTGSIIWIGEFGALNFDTLMELKVTTLICCLKSENKEDRPQILDYKKVGDLHMSIHTVVIDADDEDCSDSSWRILFPHIKCLSDTLYDMSQSASDVILITDSTGYSTSAAIFCVYMLLRKQIRVEQSVDMCVTARPSISISLSFRRGLEIMQRSLDDKRLKRLRAKARTSTMGSVAF